MRFASRPEPSQRRPRRTAEVLTSVTHESESITDPRKEITQEDWDTAHAILDDASQSILRRTDVLLIGILRLFPELREQFSVDPQMEEMADPRTDSYYMNIDRMFSSDPMPAYGDSEGESAVRYFDSVLGYMTLFPNAREDIQLDKKRTLLKKSVERSREHGDWWAYSHSAYAYYLLFPDAREELNLNEEVWKGLVRLMNVHRHRNDSDRIGVFRDTARCLVILFPERKRELQFGADTWSALQGEIEFAREEGSIDDVFKITGDMMILAADKVEILPNGQLKFTMPQSPMHKDQAVPPRLRV